MSKLPLPELILVPFDPVAIEREVFETFETILGRAILPGEVEYLLAHGQAYREVLAYQRMNEALRQCLVRYARFPALDYLGDLVGTPRLLGRAAKCIMRFTLRAALGVDMEIAAGTIVLTRDRKVRFATDTVLVIPAGETYGDVIAIAETSGTAGNAYDIGAVNILNVPISNVTAASVSITYGGADVETDERYRDRVLEAPEGFSTAGPEGAYRHHAMLAHQDIVSVAVLSPSPGVVNVYPLTADGVPSEDILSLVTAALSNKKVIPLTDLVEVLAPEAVEYSIDVTLTLYSEADATIVSAAATQALEKYAASTRLKLGADVVLSQLIGSIARIDGVYSVAFTTPSATVEIEDDQFAICTDIDVAIAEERIDG